MEPYVDITNVLQYLERAAERCPDKLAYQDDVEAVTFKEYMEAAMRIGSGLKQFSLHKDPIVILMDARHISHLKVTMGIVYAGCFYVPIDEEMPRHRIELLFGSFRLALVVIRFHDVACECPLHLVGMQLVGGQATLDLVDLVHRHRRG